ncbi:RNA polymerase sigma factor FliA [Ramlibacter sp.]|uniref:RNA polymerase sigma factor FliA n=1 Tax=Ramlibacter sp. TaxID=1917967 RepID=UPI003D1516C5
MYTAKGTLATRQGIENYLPMVRRAAARMIGRLPANVEMDDLVQAGVIGLMDAMQRYEQGHGAQFETFAMQRVRGAMLDELRGTDWVPRSVRKSQRDIAEAVRALEHELKRAPSDAEIAQRLNVTLDDYHAMLVDVRGAQLVYCDDYEAEEGDTHYLDRHVAPDTQSDPAGQLADRRFREALVAAIGDLPQREQYVMSMYYEHDMNLKEIAAVLGVTESRVSQLHSQSVARLRARLKAW